MIPQLYFVHDTSLLILLFLAVLGAHTRIISTIIAASPQMKFLFSL